MLGSGAALLGGALPWVAVVLRDGGAAEVTGSAAAPAVSGLALAGLALAGALTLTPTAVRVVLGALQLVLGGLIVAVSVPTLADPPGRSVSTVSGITGVAGDESVRALVASATVTPWPVL
ncbi:MAG TPA: Trp biosynthesis-associated membrane protein, partial [Naasia sp.]